MQTAAWKEAICMQNQTTLFASDMFILIQCVGDEIIICICLEHFINLRRTVMLGAEGGLAEQVHRLIALGKQWIQRRKAAMSAVYSSCQLICAMTNYGC